MGINICLYDETTGREEPGWDSLRYAGDRELGLLIGSLPRRVRNGLKDDLTLPPDYEPHYRPMDFAEWRAAAAALETPNPGRFEQLINLLEANPGLWVYLSY